MWGNKAKRIKALERALASNELAKQFMAETLVDERQQAFALQRRCDSLAADLKRAQNYLLGEPPTCDDCRRGHHDHDIESGTCRRPDCGCKQ